MAGTKAALYDYATAWNNSAVFDIRTTLHQSLPVAPMFGSARK
jgi:hypothetical protein